MRLPRLLTASLAGLILLGSSCSRKSDPTLLATVGFREIHVQDFHRQLSRRGGLEPQTVDKQALLQEMIDQEALYVRAVQAGLDKDPEIQRACRQLLVNQLKARELTPELERTALTATEARAWYDQHPERYQRPARIRLAALHLKAEPAQSPEKLRELQRRLAEARRLAGELTNATERGFGTLAIAFSEDQATRYQGGDQGWLEAGRPHAWLSEPVLHAAFALANPGDLSDVLTDASGVYLLKLLERHPAEPAPLSAVEAAIRHQLLPAKKQQAERAYLEQARRSVPIRTYPDRLAALQLPKPGLRPTDQPPPSLP
jgi:parvulin-like peptidyl-prolyl isomerase